MYQLPLTLETPAENLALDEALLDAAEAGELPGEVLRLWESPQPFVVLGRSSPAESEVNWDACRADGVPVHRRTSGGQAIVAGPGCLMYAAVLHAEARHELQGVDRIHDFALMRIAGALNSLASGVNRIGISDVALTTSPIEAPRKFSGNSLRLRRRWVLYHGTILYDFDLANIGRWLGSPRREPEYRAGRKHGEFLTNLPAGREELMRALAAAWDAHESLPRWPELRVANLARSKFASVESTEWQT